MNFWQSLGQRAHISGDLRHGARIGELRELASSAQMLSQGVR